MSDGNIELIYYAVAILFTCIISAFASKKFGIVVSSVISLLSILFTMGLGMMPAAVTGGVLFGGLLFFPGLTWFGFWFGRFLQKKACQ